MTLVCKAFRVTASWAVRHQDISTAPGEEVVLFTLTEAAPYREMKKR
jgi:hypothetical protein